MDLPDNAKTKHQATQAEQAAGKKLFADALRELVNREKVSAKKLGTAIGVSDFTIYQWLNGKSLPTGYHALLLDDYFGSQLAENFKNQLRPDTTAKRPRQKVEKRKAAILAEAYQSVVEQKQAVSIVNNKPEPQTTNKPPKQTCDRHLTLSILSTALDCIHLILKNLPCDNRQ